MSSYIDPRHKILYHTDRLAAIKAGKKPAPINIEIDLSNRCSLGCEWCHFAYTHTRGPLAGKVDTPNGRIPGGDLMDYELAKSIIVQAHEMGVRSITWTGGGEPTLHPRFDDIVTFAHRHGMPQGLYTNGAHITPERAALLKRVMAWVYVSLDECEAEMYKESKGVDKFEVVCQGIENLSAVDGGATVGVGYLLHDQNVISMPEMAELALSLGADYVQFRPIVNYSQDAPNEAIDEAGWVDAAIEIFNQVPDDPRILFDQERFEMYRDWNGRSYSTCHWTQVQTVITPNGKVWSCVNKREHAGALLGDLTEEPLPTIWQRSGACQVDGSCRVMCRGHIANITLDAIMTEPPHKEFI